MAEKADSRGKLFVISGPSGAGKGTICNELMSQAEPDELCLSISVTTREPRKGEKDGVNYYFISEDEFEDLKENDGRYSEAEGDRQTGGRCRRDPRDRNAGSAESKEIIS